MLTVTMLGCGGTQPLPGRALAALAVQAAGHGVLLDPAGRSPCRRTILRGSGTGWSMG